MNHVTIRQVGRQVSVASGSTILETALEAGIDYPHGCRSGNCGACKSRLLEGRVELREHSAFALSEEERRQGLILACCAKPVTSCVVAWLGDDLDAPAYPHRRLDCTAAAIDDVTHDIRRVRLAVVGGPPLDFAAGQYARVRFPGAPVRDYSMANRPGEPLIEFHIRRVPGGAASERVATALRVGDPVRVEGPYGSSHLRRSHAGPILAIAGGSGLAPIKSIVETALGEGREQPIHIYFGVRAERDLYMVDRFEALASRHRNLRFVPVLSEQDAATHLRHGLVGDAVAADLPNLSGWKAYLAGPPAMVGSAGRIIEQRGLARVDIHADIFFTPQEAGAA